MAGFSVEYAILNPAGYFFYTLYNLQGLVNKNIGNTGSIDTNDLVFAVHGLALSTVIFT